MVRDKIADRALSKWAGEQKAALHPRIQRLIALANWDLYYGPTMDGQDDDEDTEDGSKVRYPGFSEACREISDAIEGIVQDVYIDIQCEHVQTSEPEPDSYEDANPDYDPDDEDSEEFITVVNEVCWEDWHKVDAKEVKAALVGGELAQHV